MSKRSCRNGPRPPKHSAAAAAFLYGLTRGLSGDRRDRANRDTASGRNEINVTSDTPELAATGCRCRELVRKLRNLCSRISRGERSS